MALRGDLLIFLLTFISKGCIRFREALRSCGKQPGSRPSSNRGWSGRGTPARPKKATFGKGKKRWPERKGSRREQPHREGGERARRWREGGAAGCTWRLLGPAFPASALEPESLGRPAERRPALCNPRRRALQRKPGEEAAPGQQPGDGARSWAAAKPPSERGREGRHLP